MSKFRGMSFGLELVKLLRIWFWAAILRSAVIYPSRIIVIWATLSAHRFGKEWGDGFKFWNAIRGDEGLFNARG